MPASGNLASGYKGVSLSGLYTAPRFGPISSETASDRKDDSDARDQSTGEIYPAGKGHLGTFVVSASACNSPSGPSILPFSAA